ncbi:hypothetical protein LP420_35430 [Massilia sp. B-10]|nr:hypothetical protein LP420_35430 [Massilia sp. B-10]
MIAIFVAAIDEGWSLAIYCVALYTALRTAGGQRGQNRRCTATVRACRRWP